MTRNRVLLHPDLWAELRTAIRTAPNRNYPIAALERACGFSKGHLNRFYNSSARTLELSSLERLAEPSFPCREIRDLAYKCLCEIDRKLVADDVREHQFAQSVQYLPIGYSHWLIDLCMRGDPTLLEQQAAITKDLLWESVCAAHLRRCALGLAERDFIRDGACFPDFPEYFNLKQMMRWGHSFTRDMDEDDAFKGDHWGLLGFWSPAWSFDPMYEEDSEPEDHLQPPGMNSVSTVVDTITTDRTRLSFVDVGDLVRTKCSARTFSYADTLPSDFDVAKACVKSAAHALYLSRRVVMTIHYLLDEFKPLDGDDTANLVVLWRFLGSIEYARYYEQLPAYWAISNAFLDSGHSLAGRLRVELEEEFKPDPKRQYERFQAMTADIDPSVWDTMKFDT